MRPRAIRRHDLPLAVEVRRVEELEVGVPEGAPGGDVPADVVQLAEAAGEGDVGVVGEGGVSEDGEAVLCYVCYYQCVVFSLSFKGGSLGGGMIPVDNG